MAILIDPPVWPAHGTVWSHLVSDTSYEELHTFAAQLPVPRRSFDLDHYDVPASVYARAVSLGAIPATAKEVVYRLRDAGLRVRQAERGAVTPVRRGQYLRAEWARLGDSVGVSAFGSSSDDWLALGESLLARWNEPHRSYHDELHLEDVLLALDHLSVRGERLHTDTLLAAWFHDAVHSGGGSDEAHSAELAIASLSPFDRGGELARTVGELIIATVPGRDVPRMHTPLAHLLDADLAIFASPTDRYTAYASAVRTEYAHVTDADFAAGRADILGSYLQRPTIYHTAIARDLWEARARLNVSREVETLRSTGRA